MRKGKKGKRRGCKWRRRRSRSRQRHLRYRARYFFFCVELRLAEMWLRALGVGHLLQYIRLCTTNTYPPEHKKVNAHIIFSHTSCAIPTIHLFIIYYSKSYRAFFPATFHLLSNQPSITYYLVMLWDHLQPTYELNPPKPSVNLHLHHLH